MLHVRAGLARSFCLLPIMLVQNLPLRQWFVFEFVRRSHSQYKDAHQQGERLTQYH